MTCWRALPLLLFAGCSTVGPLTENGVAPPALTRAVGEPILECARAEWFPNAVGWATVRTTFTLPPPAAAGVVVLTPTHVRFVVWENDAYRPVVAMPLATLVEARTDAYAGEARRLVFIGPDSVNTFQITGPRGAAGDPAASDRFASRVAALLAEREQPEARP
jgi:hypothetical protein